VTATLVSDLDPDEILRKDSTGGQHVTITSALAGLTHPAEKASLGTGTAHRDGGIVFGVIGNALVGVSLVLSVLTALLLAQGGSADTERALAALSFGLAIAGLGTAKTGIALLLWGIVRRIWLRLAAIKATLPTLVPMRSEPARITTPVIRTPHGTATLAYRAPASLLIHRMARVMWAPMLLMGVMAVYLGLAIAYFQSQFAADAALYRSLDAWVKGTQFLGEGFLLSAVSFFLGTILGAIRSGGVEVQESLGVAVRTLRMPLTAKIFIGLMMAGLMIEVAQFAVYAYVSTISDASTTAVFTAWLGPFREFGLGLLLSGVVLALATIATALDFQFARIVELIQKGQ
jgi:hypothetical protein